MAIWWSTTTPHEAIIAAARNQLPAEQIHRTCQYCVIHRVAGFLSDEEMHVSIEGHEELVRALLARDPVAVSRPTVP